MMILGIDPGYGRLGWGVIGKTDKLQLIDCGIITTQRTPVHQGNNQYPIFNTQQQPEDVRRLTEVADQLHEILEKYKPDVVSVESLFFANNQKTVMQVSQARGVILLLAAQSGAKVVEYTPLQIKSIVTGDGHADKKAVEKMVRLQLPGVPEKLIDDTLDALAAAICAGIEKQYDNY